ncbi:Transmembrane and TPR repeat-containing protein 4 [Holothuria leucospilota]|uniref:dolichyl-phosphate-mannose--protein mannosyltransferase n=1 Tax=Holothuria leucospilota TaxID=206669 RepID=A0A9Q1BPX1_HOLLE|nr:Transmembrane and TPR repeat-containing protein 4 [Holothuria leucospilota]
MRNDQKKSRSPTKKKIAVSSKSVNGKYVSSSQVHEWDGALPVPSLPQPYAAALVALLAICCYGNSLYGSFVFDDTEAIVNNKDVLPDTPVAEIFRHDFWGDDISRKESHKSYRPLTVLTFRWDYYLAGGLHPFLFHLCNVLLHAVISVLSLFIFGVLLGHGSLGINQNTILKCPRASLLCAILFAVHPVHTESVAALVGRADLLCALFFFLSFLMYVSSCKKGAPGIEMVSCLFFCSVSMLCKEQGITVLGVCSAYDLLFTMDLSLNTLWRYLKSSTPWQCLKQHSDQWRSLLTRHVLLFATSVALLVFRVTVMGSSMPSFTPVDNPASFANNTVIRVVNYNYIYAMNVWLLLNPVDLCFDWSMGCIPLIQSATDVRILAIVALWLVGFFLLHHCAINQTHQVRVLSMALALSIITFLPASNLLFRVGFVIAERNLYLPSVGYIILVVMGANVLAKFCQKQGRLVLQGLILILILGHMTKSVHRSRQWTNDEVLYKAGLKVCPLNAKVHYNIAKAASDRGKEEEAVKSYREAIRLHPDYDHALNNLANLMKESNQIEEAEVLLQRAVTINPSFSAAWMNLGIVQASLKKYSEAQHSYEEALSYRKKYPDCYFNMGNLYVILEDNNKALNAWLNATTLDPYHFKAWLNTLSLLDNQVSGPEKI